MDNSQMIAKLNDILRHEWTGVAQYAQAGFLVSGLWRVAYAEKFFESAKESFGHAQRIGDKIVAMGGVPTIERNQIKQSDDLGEMLQFAYEFESGAVALYTEALALAEGDRPLVILLEDILLEEQDGAEEMAKFLKEHKGATGSATKGARKSG